MLDILPLAADLRSIDLFLLFRFQHAGLKSPHEGTRPYVARLQTGGEFGERQLASSQL